MYDIILWGATGFTGRQAARYLHEQYGKKGTIRWAIAGRSQQRLEAIRKKIGAPELDIIIAPGGDTASAEKIATSTKVVCGTIAPAAIHANEMVAACVKHGTDYCDLSGELHWLRSMIDQHHEEAQTTGARIINACGFDSIPSDLGVQYLQKHAKESLGEYCNHIKNRYNEGHIAVSGGSFESGKGVLYAVARDPELSTIISNAYSLNPRDKMDGPESPELEDVIFEKEFNQWVMPFPVGGINTRVVRRSHALMDFQYGKDFVYDEAELAGKGLLNKIKATVMTYMTKLFIEGHPDDKMTKFLHGNLAPKLGSGPTDKQIGKNGPFSFIMIGKTPSGKSIRGYVYSDWDPGHGGTAAMLCDTAFCLAMKREETGRIGGFTTPSVALGNVLLDHLANNAGIEFGIGQLEDRIPQKGNVLAATIA